MYQGSHGIYHLLLGTHRKSHGQNSGSLKPFSKYSRDSVPPYLQSAVPHSISVIECVIHHILVPHSISGIGKSVVQSLKARHHILIKVCFTFYTTLHHTLYRKMPLQNVHCIPHSIKGLFYALCLIPSHSTPHSSTLYTTFHRILYRKIP